MNHTSKILLAGVILLATTGVASAETGKMYVPPKYFDVVRDSSGTPVRTASGDCVRTHWVVGTEACTNLPAVPVLSISKEDRTVYFLFAKSTLTPEAKKKLDTLATTVKAMGPVKALRVAGYADRIGKAAANEKLSKKRADAVRTYLISKGIANAQVVETRWFGDSVPATKCPKNLKKSKLIECLQKDRRVEVEVDFAAPAAK